MRMANDKWNIGSRTKKPLTITLHRIEDHDLGARLLAETVDEFIDLFRLFFDFQFLLDLVSYLLESWNNATAVALARVIAIVAVADFLWRDEDESAKTKIEIVLDHEPVAENRVQLLAGQPNACHALFQPRSGSKGPGQFVAAILNILVMFGNHFRRIGGRQL